MLTRSLPWLMLLFGLAVTYYLQEVATQDAKHLLQNSFDVQTREIRSRIEQRMATYEQVLRGANGLFAASERVSRGEFRNYVSNLYLEEHYPGIQGVGFSLIVQPEDRAKHIASMRKDGLSAYAMFPPGDRETYTSIVYLEPNYGRNLRAIGYDMYSEPTRRAAMERARDFGNTAMSGKVTLVQEVDQQVQAGFLMYLPVYRNGSPQDALENRRANIIGWVYSPFRMNDLMAGILGGFVADFDLMIFDGETELPDAMMYDADNSISLLQSEKSAYEAREKLNIAGHAWILKIRSLPTFEARLDLRRTALIRHAGILFSMLLSLLTWIWVHGRTRLMQIAEQMNRELRESEFRWKFALEGSGEGLWDWDVPAGTVFFNKRWKNMLGFAEDEVGNSLDEWISRIHPEDKAKTLAAAQAYLDGKVSDYIDEHRLICKDGRWKWILDRGMVVSRGEGGRPLRMIGTHTDITARKESEQALKSAFLENKWLLEALDNVAAYIYVKDAEGRYIYANDYTLKLFGCSLDECRGKRDEAFFPPEAVQRLKEIDVRVIHFGETTENEIVVPSSLPGGEPAIYWEVKHPLRDENGAICALSGVSTDITERKKAENALRESEAFNISVLDSLQEHIVVLDTRGNIIAVNEAWRQFARVNQAPEAVIYSLGLNYLNVCGNAADQNFREEALAAQAGIKAVLEGERKSFSIEYPCHSPDEQRWFQMHVSPLKGPRKGVVVAHENITTRRLSEEALRLAGMVFNTVGEAVMVTDADIKIIAVNPAFMTVTGFTPEEVIGKNPRLLSSKNHSKEFYQALWNELLETDRWSGEIANRRKDGKIIVEWLSIRVVRDDSGNICQYVGVFTDITERKAHEARVYHLAHYDVLTDLPNRALLTDRLSQALAKARRDQTMLALMFIDLDKFKPVNDNLGHNIGDLLLKEVAVRLQTCMQRESDTVSRLGGDEFVALLPEINKDSDAETVAEKILYALNQSFNISDNDIGISASIGIAIYPQHGDEIKRLMKNADTAMYHAKNAGRNAYRFFDAGMEREA